MEGEIKQSSKLYMGLHPMFSYQSVTDDVLQSSSPNSTSTCREPFTDISNNLNQGRSSNKASNFRNRSINENNITTLSSQGGRPKGPVLGTAQSCITSTVPINKKQIKIKPSRIKESAADLFGKDAFSAEVSTHEQENAAEMFELLVDVELCFESALGNDSDEEEVIFPHEVTHTTEGYCSLGAPSEKCLKCGAIMWKEERVNKNVKKGVYEFSICCGKGQIKLPATPPTPEYMMQLYNDPKKRNKFRRLIRIYNAMFAFSSMGDDSDDPKFCQLYIYDTEHEVENRMRWVNVVNGERVDAEVVEGLLRMLDDTNELVKCFCMARDHFKEQPVQDLKIVMKVCRPVTGRENFIGPLNEVGAIMVGYLEDTCGERDIIIESKSDGIERISDIHPKLMALQYPLLFPNGEDGYHDDIPYIQTKNNGGKKRKRVTMKEFYAYKLQIRHHEGNTPRLGGRLFQQYIVDAFSAIEQARLWWFRTHQKVLRNDLYDNIAKIIRSGEFDTTNIGKGFILPASFLGSKRYMQQNFQDALAVCRHIGHPDIFLTMTTDPLWDEILEMMKHSPGCSAQDSPDIIARVFKMKLEQIVEDIKKKAYFGECVGTEIPDPIKDPIGYAAVSSFMIHEPCGLENTRSPCMKNMKYTKHFPKKYCARTTFDSYGFPVYKRRRSNITVKKGNAELDNQAIVELSKKNNEEDPEHKLPVDEIKAYFDGRYICGAEAAHRIFGFDIHYRSISVLRPLFHLTGKRNCTFRENEELQKVLQREKFKRSQLEAFFKLNVDDQTARCYTYDEIPKYYVSNDTDSVWTVQKRGTHIGRLLYTHHSSGEIWYLHLLLSKVRGPTSFNFLKTVDGVLYNTFKEACLKRGFLAEDNEWNEVLEERSKCGFPPQIRELFVQIMTNFQVIDLGNLWNIHWKHMGDDIIMKQRKLSGNSDRIFPDQHLQFYVLAEIDKLLRSIGKSLKQFSQMPQPPSEFLQSGSDNLIIDELSFNITEMEEEFTKLYEHCNDEQLVVYNAITNVVQSKIVLPVTSSRIDATLVPGGRTAHSRFKIPIVLDKKSSCGIAQKSNIPELIKCTSLIIWNEAPMKHRHAFECLDRSLRDIMKSVSLERGQMPFGGITILLGGDFRQILRVITLGSRGDIVVACITRSRLWSRAKIFILKQNMRLKQGQDERECELLRIFVEWVLKIGDGKITVAGVDFPDLDEDDILIPSDFYDPESPNTVENMIE
ncbi:hypothetical protein AgCh_031714 [Apium graveolens]